MGRKRRSSSDEESKKENQVDKVTALKNAAAANSRERARMQVLSKAFVKLKTTLPWVPPDTKLSKLDTLRLATSYIAHLRQILAEDDASSGSSAGGGGDSSEGEACTSAEEHSPQPAAAGVHPINFTWPYSFHGKVTAHPDPMRSPDRGDAPTAKLPIIKPLPCQTRT